VIVEWSRRAIDHLVHLRAYIARENPNAATRVATDVLTAVDHLAAFPNAGRPGRLAGTRELVVSHTPYVLAYRLRGDRLEVLAVFHGRQRWPKHL
jgi:toxin ParE1/3/4